jgi:hypothetical protein
VEEKGGVAPRGAPSKPKAVAKKKDKMEGVEEEDDTGPKYTGLGFRP